MNSFNYSENDDSALRHVEQSMISTIFQKKVAKYSALIDLFDTASMIRLQVDPSYQNYQHFRDTPKR